MCIELLPNSKQVAFSAGVNGSSHLFSYPLALICCCRDNTSPVLPETTFTTGKTHLKDLINAEVFWHKNWGIQNNVERFKEIC